jgi:hypothetical protein
VCDENLAAVVCFVSLPAYAADGQISKSSLNRIGLAGLTPISDAQGLEVRGLGVQEAMGWDEGWGDHKEYGHDKHDHYKQHEHKHHEKHENCLKDCHPKPHCNIISTCHAHCGKG